MTKTRTTCASVRVRACVSVPTKQLFYDNIGSRHWLRVLLLGIIRRLTRVRAEVFGRHVALLKHRHKPWRRRRRAVRSRLELNTTREAEARFGATENRSAVEQPLNAPLLQLYARQRELRV